MPFNILSLWTHLSDFHINNFKNYQYLNEKQ